VVEDPDSYWHQGGGEGSWTPEALPVAGQAVTSMPRMMAAAGLMDDAVA
jgi:hypothetical protein